MSVQEYETRFIKTLNGLCGSRHKWQVFSDFLELAAIAQHNAPYTVGDFPKDETYEALEAQYLERAKRYSREELQGMAELMALTTLAHREAFGDFLGEIASEQGLLNQDGGQFFTPYDLCRLMAKMTLGNVRPMVEKKGLITIDEPACGGGALVIAAAEEMYHQQIDPRSCAQFQCTDVSRDAFNMCYLQLALQGLQAIFYHGNTLTLDLWESRPTPQLRYFNEWLQERQQLARLESLKTLFTDPETFFAAREAEDEQQEEETAEAIASNQTPSPAINTAAVVLGTSGTEEQMSIFAIEPVNDHNPAVDKSKRQRPKPDIILPSAEQMSLFGNDQEQG
ncbi:MAG: N-6 DNA methylase [Cyanobacteria bacterium P01_F01_bin.42]